MILPSPLENPRTPIAIVGYACRFPGSADSSRFWQLIQTGGCAIGELPANRLDRELYYSPDRGRLGKSYSTIGGIVQTLQNDPELAGISPELLDNKDEAHRHLAAVVLAACREAGLASGSPTMTKSGIYLAHLRGSALAAGLTYARSVEQFIQSLPCASETITRQLVEEVRGSYPPLWHGDRAAQLHPTAALKLLRALTGCSGPAINVDAACASSFQALDLAVRALRCGEVEQAVVCSASYNNWHSMVLFSQAQALSAKGSFPFDQRADGFVSSDGYAAVVLKPLPAAVRDGDTIHGVIRGICMSSDGAGRSLWAPRKEGQIAAIRRAWECGPNPAGLQYIEAHGTSTQLGDATEIAALTEALGHDLAGLRIPIASVKANIGHSRESAGLAGLIKCMLAMRHGVIPPAVPLETPNPEIPWSQIPFYVPQQLTAWPRQKDGGARLAGIDSFGIGGLNAHVVLEDYVASTPHPPARTSPRPPEGIAIVGVGCVLPGANCYVDFRRLLQSGLDMRKPAPDARWGVANGESRPVGGFVEFSYDWRSHKIPPKTLETADPLQFMVLEAAGQAWASAGLSTRGSGDEPRNHERTAVVVGTVFSGEFRNQLNLGLYVPDFKSRLLRVAAQQGISAEESANLADDFEVSFLARNPALRDETGSFTSSTLASRLARTYDLMGGAYAVDAGECSSMAALSGAAQMLRAGDCDLAVCAAGQRSMDAVSFELAARFTAQWSPAEGAVVMLLKRVSDARAAGDRIFGVIGEISVAPTKEHAAHDPIIHKIGNTLAAAGLVSLLKQVAREEDGTIRISGDAGLTWSADVRCAGANKGHRESRRTAFLFGGQGAHYQEMLRTLVDANADAAAALAECNAIFHDLSIPAFADFAWSAKTELGSSVRDTQLAALAADYILFRSIGALRIKPDVVAGYSYGDFAALVACGSLTLRDAVLITLERCRLLDAVPGALLAIRLGRQEFETVAWPQIHLAIHCSPEQLIVGGTVESIRAFTLEAEHRGWNPIAVPVPRPYHTPLLGTIAAEFGKALGNFQFKPPCIPYLSTVENRYLADPRELRASLVRHLVEPVEYDASIRRLAAENTTIFAEIGPRQSLTRLHRHILGEHAAGITFADHPDRPLEQLNKVRDLVLGRASKPIYYDATGKRRSRMSSVAGTAEASAPLDQIEEFLVRFICERTGYPAELVDMNADLEADLGIDSIRRAELLGEVHETYNLEMRSGERISLADFSTLRKIHAFIVERRRAASNAAPAGQRLAEFTGTPYQMGVQHGQQYGEVIRQSLQRYRQVVEIAEPFDFAAALGITAFDQLRGMADALQIPVAELAAYNVALYPRQLPGCLHFAVPAQEGMLVGANEDAPLVLEMGGAMFPLLQLNRPDHGIAHVVTGVAGKVGGINGLNARGLSITSALLLDRHTAGDDDAGLFHPALVQQLLSKCSGIDAALRLLQETHRRGAWSMILTECATGRICHLEYDRETIVINDRQQRAMASNHALLLSPGQAAKHSLCRLSRLRLLLDEEDGLSVDRAQAILLDRESSTPSMNTLCRVDHLGSFLVSSADKAIYSAPRGAKSFQRVDAFTEAVTSRYVLRLRAEELAASNVPLPTHACLIGNAEKIEQAAAALRSEGVECSCAKPSSTAIEQYFHVQTWLGRTSSAARRAVVAISGEMESVGFSGFLKALAREFPTLRVKAIDTDAGPDPAAILLEELRSGDSRIEVIWRNGRRYARQLEACPNPAGGAFHNTGAWVVTGGAKGITARCVAALVARFGIGVHIIGRSAAKDGPSPFPYYSCDIRDRKALASVLDQIRASEPITGILHGAGVEYSAGFLRKQQAQVRETLEVKVQGAMNLIELTAIDSIAYFVGFGSAAGRFGGMGQTDYAMASEQLATLTGKLRQDRPSCRAVTFHWPAWGETGMAVRPQTRVMLEMADRRFMPVEEGIAHLIRELEAGLPEAEVLIFDGQSSRDLDDSLRVNSTTSVTKLDPANDFFLRDHRYRSFPLLPAAASLDLMLRGTPLVNGQAFLRIANFRVAGPLRFNASESHQVRVETTQDRGAFQCRLSLAGTGRLLAHAEVARIADAQAAEAPTQLAAPVWKPYRYRTAREAANARTLFYGPSMRCLKQIAGDAYSLQARMQATAAHKNCVINVALLDACLVACGSWAVRRLKVKPLAHGFDQLLIGRSPKLDEWCTLKARYLGREDDLLLFDFNLRGADEDLIYSAKRCSLVVTRGQADD